LAQVSHFLPNSTYPKFTGNAQKWGLPRESSRPTLPEIKIDSEAEEKLNTDDEDQKFTEDEEMEQLMQLRRASHVGSVVLDLID
jgi:hypothetical protein